MDAITSISHSLPNTQLFINRLTTNNLNNQIFVTPTIEELPAEVLNYDLVNQIPEETVSQLNQIFQDLNILSSQSLELDQSIENRILFQQGVTDDLFALRSLFENASLEELELFNTVFASQISDSLLNTGSVSSSDDSFLSANLLPDNLLSGSLSPNIIESLFSIDVTSDQGSLASLELLNIFLDFLSNNSLGFGSLNDLLIDQDNYIFNLQILEITGIDDELEIAPAETESLQTTEALGEAELLQPEQNSENPPTIIELAG